jgi:hypothetical protein
LTEHSVAAAWALVPALAAALLSGLVGLLALPMAASRAGDLSDQERRGRQVYVEGTSPSGALLSGRLGRIGVRLPASAIPCVGCHGPDGRGRAEGGVSPSDITWSNLTKAYGQRHESGRSHPPYDARTLEKAILRGEDPAGNRLDQAMPRYDLPPDDLAALIAYIRRLELLQAPGITEHSIAIGLTFPNDPEIGAVWNSVEATLSAYFDDLNATGGIYRRRLRLVAPAAPEDVFAAIGDPDALVDGKPAGEALPIIVPMTFSPESSARADRSAYFLFPPVADQMLALIEHMRRTSPKSDVSTQAVLLEDGSLAAAVKPRIEKSLGVGEKQVELITVTSATFERRLVEDLARRNVGSLSLLAGPDLVLSFAQAAAAADLAPSVYLLGMLMGPQVAELAARWRSKVWVAYPNLPGAASPQGTAEFRALLRNHKLAENYPAIQTSAIAAAKVLIEALRKSGRAATREGFVRALQSLHGFESGLTPRLSFGPNHRIGTQGIFLMEFDLSSRSFRSEPVWIGLP